jgi:hypothetical protein
MKSMDKTEIKIFLTFFLIYSFFVQWATWNEESRFALTRAIVEEKNFEIDSFANQTGDRSYWNGHYYSDKNPGVSFLVSFIYIILKNAGFIEREENKVGKYITLSIRGFNDKGIPIQYNPNPGLTILISQIFVTIFASSLPSALTILLIYKISTYLLQDEKKRMLITFTMGIGTLLFPIAVVFWDHAMATFFAFLSFFILFKSHYHKISKKYIFLCGIFLAYSIVCNIISLGVALPFLIYLLLRREKKDRILTFLAGGIIGFLPLLFYCYSIFGDIFIPNRFLPALPMYFTDKNIWLVDTSTNSSSFYTPVAILRKIIKILFLTERGLFFYYPILLFSFIGLFLMYKKFKKEVLFIFLTFVTVTLIVCKAGGWWGGISFGPRHLALFIPFLSLPLSYAFNKIKIKIIFPFLVWSIFVNLIGIQAYELVYQNEDIRISKSFSEVQQKFILVYNGELEKLDPSQFRNPLLEYNLPLFLRNGPRSKLFESIFFKHKPDIRYVPHATISVSFSKLILDRYLEPSEIPLCYLPNLGIVTLRTPFLCLIPLGLVLLIIWKDEVSKILKINKKYLLLFLFLFLISIFIIFFIDIKSIVYGDNWYPWQIKQIGGTVLISRYTAPNATLFLLNNDVSFFVRSFNKPNTLEIYIDGVPYKKYQLVPENYANVSIKLEKSLKRDKTFHMLLFYPFERCDILPEVGSQVCFEVRTNF